MYILISQSFLIQFITDFQLIGSDIYHLRYQFTLICSYSVVFLVIYALIYQTLNETIAIMIHICLKTWLYQLFVIFNCFNLFFMPQLLVCSIYGIISVFFLTIGGDLDVILHLMLCPFMEWGGIPTSEKSIWCNCSIYTLICMMIWQVLCNWIILEICKILSDALICLFHFWSSLASSQRVKFWLLFLRKYTFIIKRELICF